MTVTFSTTPSSSRMLRSGVARLMSLMSVSCLAGVTDSAMSPYLCPEVRARTGSPEAGLCGLMISARFATHILLIPYPIHDHMCLPFRTTRLFASRV